MVLVQTNGRDRSFQLVDQAADLADQLADGGEGAAVDRLSFDDAEPDLDQIHPGG